MMDNITQIVIAVFASSGFWAVVNAYLQMKRDKKTASAKKVQALESGVLGLLHETLITKCEYYIQRGSITESEFRDLDEYIYQPYRGLNGNGTGEEYMRRVRELLFQGGRS